MQRMREICGRRLGSIYCEEEGREASEEKPDCRSYQCSSLKCAHAFQCEGPGFKTIPLHSNFQIFFATLDN